MAVMAEGQILKQGNPSELIAELDNTIWKKIVKYNEVAELEENHLIISKKLYAGKTIIHVQAPEAPEGFESTPADLEDVYFSSLGASQSRANSSTQQVRG
jgi:ABC-type proline/glycine betaine transport system ATPase subunit